MDTQELIKTSIDLSTKTTSEKIVRLSRLIISLKKILASFDSENKDKVKETQVVHLQLIDSILYKDPDFFADKFIEEFRSIRNAVDVGIDSLPLKQKHKQTFQNVLEDAESEKENLRRKSKIYGIFKFLLSIAVLIYLAFVFTSTIKSSLCELRTPCKQVEKLQKSENDTRTSEQSSSNKLNEQNKK